MRPAVLLLIALAAQTPSSTFEVASVKPNTSSSMAGAGPRAQVDRFTASNVNLMTLIGVAYSLNADHIVGGPSWLGEQGRPSNGDRFDIAAKASAPFSPPRQWQVMLQALLADRFMLKVHKESREEPVFDLVVARTDGKLGRQLRPAAADCAALIKAQPNTPFACGNSSSTPMTGQMTVRGMSMDTLAGLLSRDAGRRVINKTGLTGNYDWELMYTPQVFLNSTSFNRERFPTIDPDGPSVFTAVEEQLGLKLQSDKAQGEFLVIERVEHPTPD